MVGHKKLFKKISRYIKKHQRKLKRFGIPIIVVLLVFSLGMFTQKTKQERRQPSNLVWGIDGSVEVPKDLRKMLQARNDCNDYRGYESQPGVGLWAVVQVEQNSFAKVTHGCSWALNNQALAVKQHNKWKLISGKDYFSDTVQGTPTCTALVAYKVPVKLEGFCMNDSGELAKNPNP